MLEMAEGAASATVAMPTVLGPLRRPVKLGPILQEGLTLLHIIPWAMGPL
jgi:hypothetical protein